MRRLLPAGVALALSLISVQTASAASPGTWSATGSMATARFLHTATLLPNGKVLVAGGDNNGTFLQSAELYDPTTGTWSGSTMPNAHYAHTATLLGNGKVLVAGGVGSSGFTRKADIFDPASGLWSSTGSLNTARYTHVAALLPNGNVLVAGGTSGCNGDGTGTSECSWLASAEIYDPVAGTWSAAAPMNQRRKFASAVLLHNGKILVAGGEVGPGGYTPTAELYDYATNTWTPTPNMTSPRWDPMLTLLANGTVLVAGGYACCSPLSSAEIYDPNNGPTGAFAAIASMGTARNGGVAPLLPNGQVLVAGGGSNVYNSSAEIYDPGSRTWSATSSMAAARINPTATLLGNGRVLVAGGQDPSGSLASAELFQISDLSLSLSISPTTATTGTVVTAAASLTNNSSSSQTVTLQTTLAYVNPSGGSTTFSTSTTQVTLAAGQTVSRTTQFKISNQAPRGSYTITVQATDSSGSITASATLNVN